MSKIKSLFASLLFSLTVLFPAVVMAKNSNTTQVYTSKALGITVEVPSNAIANFDNSKDGLVFTTADTLFVFAAVPFDVSALSKDEMAAEYAKFAKSAKIDFSKTVFFRGKTETMEYEGDLQNFPSGSSCLVSMVVAKGSNHSFYITVVAGPDYIKNIHTLFRTLKFDASVIK